MSKKEAFNLAYVIAWIAIMGYCVMVNQPTKGAMKILLFFFALAELRCFFYGMVVRKKSDKPKEKPVCGKTLLEIELIGGPMNGKSHSIPDGMPCPNAFGLISDDKKHLHWYEIRPFENAADFVKTESCIRRLD